MSGAQKYFQKKIEECGGNVVKGIFKGIKDGIASADWNDIADGFFELIGVYLQPIHERL